MNNPLAKFELVARKAYKFSRAQPCELGPVHPFEARNGHQRLPTDVRDLFDNGHYAQAAFEAFKFVDRTVQRLAKADKPGTDMMMKTFSEISPVVKVNANLTQSEKDEQRGYKFIFAGAILATRTGGFAVGLLMAPWAGVDLPRGLANGGLLIGILERGLIFLLVMVDQAAGIGFLIAAKSVLRFETTSKDQRAGEYVIIGTLASFGWALLFAYATRYLLAALPPIEITPPLP